VEIEPVTPDRWDDFVDLFERRGPRGGSGPIQCSCMWWRERARSAEGNRRAMEEIVRGGGEPGLLAYEDGLAVGWVSVAPRGDYGHLVRSRTYGPADHEPDVWSIVCFYVHGAARHAGVAAALLDAAVARAAAGGASAVEAYPHRRRPDYMGSRSMFAAAGFTPVRDAGPRTIMRYSVP
jgi:GNAT superfamily N-acetyltransferase